MRDPRKDPRPGDVVGVVGKLKAKCWNLVTTETEQHKAVSVSLEIAAMSRDFIGQTHSRTLEQWRQLVKNAEVLHVAEDDAREAVTPTAADLAVADELDLLAEHIREYIGIDDARDEIRRICLNRAVDLRKGVSRSPTAAEVIAAAKEALEGVAFARHVKSCRDAMKLIAAWEAAQR